MRPSISRHDLLPAQKPWVGERPTPEPTQWCRSESDREIPDRIRQVRVQRAAVLPPRAEARGLLECAVERRTSHKPPYHALDKLHSCVGFRPARVVRVRAPLVPTNNDSSVRWLWSPYLWSV